ncbi:MAG: prolyl oligopeptidase family serine peptidase [Terracidiphilus sp.]
MRHASPRLIFCCIAGAAFAIAVSPANPQAAAGPSTAYQAASATAAEPHLPGNEDLRHLKALGVPMLSPDGKRVLFAVTEATADGAAAHFWLAPVGVAPDDQQKAWQITFSPPSDKLGEHSAEWAPDGSAIYFLAKRGEHTQLFRLDMRGGEGSPYDLKVLPVVDESKIPGAIPPPGASSAGTADNTSGKPAEAAPQPLALDVSGYAPSQDGRWLAVWARDPETPGEKRQKDAKADASWVNHELHGTRLYLAALKPDGAVDGALKPVAVLPNVRAAVWSPAADRLLVLTEKPNGAPDLGPAGAGWLVDAAAPDKPVELKGIPATVGGGSVWRPDGAELAFSAQTPEDAPPGYGELFALAMRETGTGAEVGTEIGTGPARRLSAWFAGQLYGPVAYSAAGDSLVTEAGMGTRVTPVRIALDGKTAPATVDLGTSLATGLNSNRAQTGWVWLAESGGQPAKLCFAKKLGEPCQTVPTPELAPANLRWVKPELIHWENGGFTIEGLLNLPQPASASEKVPLIVVVHGGPFGAFVDGNDPFVAFLVGHGWAVLRPNPRGSSNYGVRFAAANKNDLGGGDYQDVMAGVDSVLAKYPLDANRMALVGYSYGGEMAGFVEGKTDRFKAIVSGAPVIDQYSEYGTENDSWYDRWYFGKPWEHFDDAWRQSPLSGASRAKTPFLLLQGDSDTTDPVGQSEEMYRALRQEGAPVELVTYPRENHGPLGAGIFGIPSQEPWHGFDGRQRIVEFIEKAFGATGSKP